MTHDCTPDCTAGWSPGNKCHCRSCGENFTNVRNFHRHRPGGECVPPITIPKKKGSPLPLMELNSRGYWREVGEIDRGELFRRSVVTHSTGNGYPGGAG